MSPGDVCIYSLRAECGVPAMEFTGAEVSTLDIYTIDYDDTDLSDSEVQSIDSINAAGSSSGVAGIPVPKMDCKVSDEGNFFGRDDIVIEYDYGWRFGSGVTEDGLNYTTVSYSRDSLEVNFGNGSIS